MLAYDVLFSDAKRWLLSFSGNDPKTYGGIRLHAKTHTYTHLHKQTCRNSYSVSGREREEHQNELILIVFVLVVVISFVEFIRPEKRKLS